jgi:hypothetical protein
LVFRPTTTRTDAHARPAFRAVIWVNSRCSATQIFAGSYNVAAVLINLKGKKLILVACYEARAADTEAGRERDLATKLQTLEATIQKARQETGTGQLELMICADLNRYHVLWDGTKECELANEGAKAIA